jgi:glycosyltransferase involved in cell wall biosynthesis
LRDHADVLRLLARHSIFVNPSLVEGFGISTIEAAALGVPYVASDIPAFRYATRGGKGGILFEPGNPVSCARALEKLLNDSETYARKREEGRGLAEAYRPQMLGPTFERCLLDRIQSRAGVVP